MPAVVGCGGRPFAGNGKRPLAAGYIAGAITIYQMLVQWIERRRRHSGLLRIPCQAGLIDSIGILFIASID
jgi:hypothetical protein